MTPYVLDRRVASSARKDQFISDSVVDMVSETEASSAREGSIGSREDSSIVSSVGKPKHAALKRVSFGSSKGSMVETVIFDDTDLASSPYKPIPHVDLPREDHIQLTPPAKVKVTYYESQKPHYVTTPDSSEFSFNLLTLSSTMASSEDVQKYINMNTGLDNPFRPEGQLSREAENLVKQVQSGQPFASWTQQNDTETSNKISKEEEPLVNSVETSPAIAPAFIEVQHGIVIPPSSSSNVEQVKIKKKPKCFCCVIL